MIKKVMLLSVLCLIFNSTFSQEINLFIKDIKEERHLENEESFVELTSIIKGLKVDDLNQIKLHKITKAIDEVML